MADRPRNPRKPTLTRPVERLINGVAIIVAWATVVPIAFFSVVQMLDRKLKIGVSSVLPDISTALLFIMIMMLFGYTYLRDGHVRVDVFRRRWSGKTLALIEIAGCCLILLPLAGILCVYGWDGLMRTTRFAEISVWAARIAAVIGPALLGLAGVIVIARNVTFLRGQSETGAPQPREKSPAHD